MAIVAEDQRMSSYLSRFLLCLITLGIGVGNVQANTIHVQVGGATADGGDGYGGGTTPVLAFSPTPLTINVGDTVVFTNLGGTTAAHNIHADDDSFRCANGCRGDGSGATGDPASNTWNASVTFSKPGTVGYHCDNHGVSGMTGSIIVKAATPTINLGGYLSGNWFIPTQGGSGFQLEFTNAAGSVAGTLQALAIWFVYTPDGAGQNWVFSQGDYSPASNTTTLPAEILIGTQFPPNYVAANVHALNNGLWGHITFTFSGCNDGTVSWHSDFTGYNGTNDTSFPIQRLTQIAGTTCP
jgi:plastocyanin